MRDKLPRPYTSGYVAAVAALGSLSGRMACCRRTFHLVQLEGDMEGFGIEKLSLVLVIALVLFGARRIPEIGGSIGKGIREFKRGMRDVTEENDRPPETGADTRAAEAESIPPADAEPKRLLGR